MADSSTPSHSHLIDIYGAEQQIATVFYRFAGVILAGMVIGVLASLSNNDYQFALIIALCIVPSLLALLLIRRHLYELAAIFLSLVLFSMITVLATLGLGIHHISNLGYPALLIVASMVTSRRTMIFLTLYVMACVSWLYFGEAFGIYTPLVLKNSVPGDWVTTVMSIVVTAFMARLLTEYLFRNNLTLNQELAERKRAQDALRESETRLLQIASTIQEVFWLRDVQTLAVLYVNPAYETIWGRTCASLYENPASFLDAVHADDKARIMQAVATQRQQGTLFNEEYRIVQSNGNVRWVWGRTFPIRNEQGQVYRIAASVMDITELKLAQAEIQRQTEQLQALRQIGMQIAAELDPAAVLRSITENALKLCGGITSSLYLYRPDLDLLERQVYTGPSLVPSHATRKLGEGMMGKVWETNAPMLINDYASWDGGANRYTDQPSRAVMGVPIRYGNDFLGVLNVIADHPQTFSQDDLTNLCMFADQAAIAIKNAQLYTSLQQVSITDELTGLFNRRGLNQLGEREVERSLRFNHPLTAIMLDIDHFKLVNDTFGHPVGDRVLRALADVCRAQMRSVDILTRYGGEEFFFLLPETELAQGIQTAERLRQAIQDFVLPLEPTAEHVPAFVQITVSQGVAKLDQLPSLAALIKQTDEALYNAKQTGRNRVATPQ